MLTILFTSHLTRAKYLRPRCYSLQRESYRPDLNRRPHPYQGCALPAELLQLFTLKRWLVLVTRFLLSGRRGSNPPPIAWKAIALPNELLPLLCRFVGKSGLEPLNSEEDRFTVCCNCHYATSPFFLNTDVGFSMFEPMKGLEPPTG